MQKLFDCVISITVTEDLEITHLNDAEGESVKFKDAFDGNSAELEDWLNAFEDEMRASLKDYTLGAIAAAPKMKWEQGLSQFPAQVVLTATQILWTQQVTTVLQGQQLRGLKVLQTKFVEDLDGLTALARQPITRLVRQVVSCMFLFEVHNRDIISGLVADAVSDVESFK
jgi:hypothetical protein